MGYYDSVKENVKNQATDNNSGSSGSSSSSENFDTLKEAASETEPDEEKGDDTPIEVLEEDGLSRNPKREKKSSNKEESQNSDNSNPFRDDEDKQSSSTAEIEADLSNVEEKLDTIIEQNQELIKILKSFTE
ncbi:MAG: hypothetical protein ABEK10_03075 [Candidatus Nanosalina sp.]